MESMRKGKVVYLSQLEELAILWPGDIRALAEFIVRSYDAGDRERNEANRGTIQKSRPTLYGLARDFSMLTRIQPSRVERELESHGFDLSATVELDLTAAGTKGAK
jgi:hypothetical protein